MVFRKPPPLMQCTVRHELPGRIRVACRGLRYLGAEVDEIRDRLAEAPAVRSVAVTAVTGTVLVQYDQAATTGAQILELVEGLLGNYALVAYKGERLAQNAPTVQERRLQEEPIGELVARVAVTTASLGFSWLGRGRAVAPPTSFVGRFLTMPALTALSLAGPIISSGFQSLRTRMRPNADTLSSTAILASLAAGQDVSALTIIWLADIAELLTAYTMDRTRRAIKQMLAVGEERVWRIGDDGTEEQVPLDALAVGDQILVPTGEKISADGTVESGEAAVDQASITGEFMPARKTAGDAVFAGTVVKSGRLFIRAERVGDQTAVARIVHLVEEATHRKAAIQTIADRVSARCATPFYAGAARLTAAYCHELRDILAGLLGEARPTVEEVEARMQPRAAPQAVPMTYVPGVAPSW